MGANSKIEWTHHTFNPWWGCVKVSDGCKHCYAERMAERLQAMGQENYRNGFALTLQPQMLELPLRWKTPQTIFVNSMSDWLDDEVPLEWLAFLLETLAMCPNVDFQLLTKRPEKWKPRVNLVSGLYDLQTEAGRKAWAYSAEWYVAGKAPDNLWIGTTVEDHKAADTRIPHLLEIPAKVRFLSCEPLVGPIDISHLRQGDNQWFPLQHLHWVIAGGESGGAADPMHPDWLRSLRHLTAREV